MSSIASAPQTIDLRYPVGEFQYAGPSTPEERAQQMEILAQAPARLRAAVDGLSDSQLDTPYRPDGWTIRQVVHHVADSHMNSYIRFRLALTETDPIVKPYQESLWAELPDAKGPLLGASLGLLECLHQRWVALLATLSGEQWQRRFHHPECGPVTLDNALALYAWHSRHHVAHIQNLRTARGW